MQRSRFAPLFPALLTMCLVCLTPDVVMAQNHGTLYAAVTDRSGAPVLDLTADDFELAMDGTALTLASVELDTGPKLALVVDNSQGMAEAQVTLRTGLMNFLETLDRELPVGLFTIGGQVRRRKDFSTEREELLDTASSIFVDTGTGMKLVEGLMETWDRRFEDEDRWPIFTVIASDYPDTSGFVNQDDYNEFVTELRLRGATVHAVVLLSGQLGQSYQLAGNLAQNTGGSFLPINNPTGLPNSLTELAEQVNAQTTQASTRYQIVYEVPDDYAGSGELSMQVGRSGTSLRLFADRRLPQ